MVISSLAAIMPTNRREIDPLDQFLARLIRGKSTYPGCSDLPNHLSAAGAEIPGTIDLLAIGPSGCLLIDHKSGGVGDGLGPYLPQLSTYAGVVRELLPASPLQGVAVFWIDHGRLTVVEMARDEMIAAPSGVN